MRLWIDVREACRERMTGKGQWTHRCVSELLTRSDVQVTLVSDSDIPSSWNDLPGLHHVAIVAKKGLMWHVSVWRMLLREKENIDAYLSPTSFIVPFLIGRSVPVISVVHDLIAFRHEPHDRKATFIERWTLPRAMCTAHAVCCVSDATAVLVRHRFSVISTLHTVGAGPTIDERDTWNGTAGHILCIATLCPRKNQLRLIHAYASLPETIKQRTPLMLVGGRGWHDAAIVSLAASTPGVRWIGFQSAASCAELLRTCAAFAFVSTEEGFGLPVLDALRVGAPVLASDIPSLREVGRDTVMYCDPLSVSSVAEGLERILHTGNALRASGLARSDTFSWKSTAERVYAACSR